MVGVLLILGIVTVACAAGGLLIGLYGAVWLAIVVIIAAALWIVFNWHMINGGTSGFDGFVYVFWMMPAVVLFLTVSSTFAVSEWHNLNLPSFTYQWILR